jgi:hypothetical protein
LGISFWKVYLPQDDILLYTCSLWRILDGDTLDPSTVEADAVAVDASVGGYPTFSPFQ